MSNQIDPNKLTEPIAVIRINKLYRKSLTPDELYDITRGYWNLNRAKAEACNLVFAVYRGVVKEVYRVDSWVDSLELEMCTTINPYREGYGFNGHVAEGAVRNRFLGCNIANWFKHGDQCPVRVFGNIGDTKDDKQTK